MADNHLGYRQYGLYQREIDYYDTFKVAIEKIQELRPDFVIHSGDLFEFFRSPPKALFEVQKGLKKLQEKNIPVYAIPGNHDSVARVYAQPPQVLFQEFNLKILTFDQPFFIKNDVFIGGIRYLPKYYQKNLLEKIDQITTQALKYNKRILVLHQAVDKYLNFNYELEIGDLPQDFDYYAMGHIHDRILTDYGMGKFAYAGSTNLWRKNEYASFKKKGKGFYLVDLDSDIPDVQPINLEFPREIISDVIKSESFNADISRIKQSLAAMKVKPLLYLDVLVNDLNLNLINKTILNSLSEFTLSIRPNFQIQSKENNETRPIEIHSISNFLLEYCRDRKDLQKISKNFESPDIFFNMVLGLYDTLSSDDKEGALDVCNKAYEGFK